VAKALMIIAFALCRLLPPFDAEGEGYEKTPKIRA
jgi:hypothetical protein